MAQDRHQAPKLDDARTLALISQGAPVEEILKSIMQEPPKLDAWTLELLKLFLGGSK